MAKRKKKKHKHKLKKDTLYFIKVGIGCDIVGIIFVLLGMLLFHGVTYDDIRNIEGTVTDYSVSRHRADNTNKSEKYECTVYVSYIVDDEQYSYTYTSGHVYDSEYDATRGIDIGDKKKLRVAVTENGVIVNPETKTNNTITTFGFALIVFSLFLYGMAFLWKKI